MAGLNSFISKLIMQIFKILSAIFLSYVVIGIAIPVLPLHIHNGLGLSTLTVGIVVGCQFMATLASRVWSGRGIDKYGAKRILMAGLLIASLSGIIYGASLSLSWMPRISVAVLLLGRVLLGVAESFIVLSALSMLLSSGGSEYAGKMMSWVGIAMYCAYALGAPVGTWSFGLQGFKAVALLTFIIPLLSILLIYNVRDSAPAYHEPVPLKGILMKVLRPGTGLALSSVGFGAVTTFTALFYTEQGWGMVWAAFSAVSVFFILSRMFFGHLPDKYGGVQIALLCVVIESAGQLIIWLSHSSLMVLIGASLTGLGYSLVYPGFGVVVVRSVSPAERSMALGIFTACLDLALGITNPVLGLIADHFNTRSVFLVSAVAVLCATFIAFIMMKPQKK